MKLRLRGNSVRIRLDQQDLTELIRNGRVEDGIRFGDNAENCFSYAVELDESTLSDPRVRYVNGQITVELARVVAEKWSSGNQVGFETHQTFGDATVRIVLEKDFACLDRPPSQAEDDRFAFPNPAATCSAPT